MLVSRLYIFMLIDRDSDKNVDGSSILQLFSEMAILAMKKSLDELLILVFNNNM